jgi:hypothetical protein
VVPRPETFWERVAHVISQLGSPPVLGLFALVLVTLSLKNPEAWLWFGVYAVVTVAVPVGFLVWQVRHGHVTDLDVQLREQRSGSLLVTIAGFTVAWAVLWIGQAPPLLTALAAMEVIQWAALFLITLRWKISVHSATASGVSMIIVHLFGRPAMPLLLSIPLVAWSRVKLRRHTAPQTLAGILLGGGIFAFAVLLIPSL